MRQILDCGTFVGVSAAVTLSEREWILRPFNAETDADWLYYALGVSYSRGAAGRRANASRAGVRMRTPDSPVPDQAAVDQQVAFLESHRPIWNWLLANADVTVAVDRHNPDHSIWAWAVTTGDDVIHAVGVKRDMIVAGFGRELVEDLLGDRMRRFQVVTLELPQMRSNRQGWKPSKDLLGFDRPKEWALDPAWLARMMVTR